MTKADFALLLGILASGLFILQWMREQSTSTPAQASGGISLVTNGPTISFGNRAGPGQIPTFSGPTQGMGGSMCGCGGSVGDYAVAQLSPVVAAAQRTLPMTRPPSPMMTPTDPPPFLSNGAFV